MECQWNIYATSSALCTVKPLFLHSIHLPGSLLTTGKLGRSPTSCLRRSHDNFKRCFLLPSKKFYITFTPFWFAKLFCQLRSKFIRALNINIKFNISLTPYNTKKQNADVGKIFLPVDLNSIAVTLGEKLFYELGFLEKATCIEGIL